MDRKTVVLLFFGALFISSMALGQEKSFDIKAHCKQVSEFAGGSYSIEEGCRRHEQEAQSQLANLTIPDRVQKHCYKVGAFAGGSYSITLGCIKRELEAKERLGE